MSYQPDFERGKLPLPDGDLKTIQKQIQTLHKEKEINEEKFQKAQQHYHQINSKIDFALYPLNEKQTILKARQKLEKYKRIYYFTDHGSYGNPFNWKDTKTLIWEEFDIRYRVSTVDISENVDDYDKEINIEMINNQEFYDQIKANQATKALKEQFNIDVCNNLDQWIIRQQRVADGDIHFDDCEDWSGCGLDAFQGVYCSYFHVYIIDLIEEH